jgi:hypothetical protein
MQLAQVPPGRAPAEVRNSASRTAATGRPLDLHEGIATNGCTRWPPHLRLASSTGRLVPGRCRATNLCRYCQALFVIETVEALTLDALGGSAPAAYAVLTAPEHLTRAEFNGHLKHVRRKLQRLGWSWEHFVQVEFQRRGALHANLLLKIERQHVREFRVELLDEWCGRVDGAPDAQYCELVADALAVAKYTSKMLAHGLKQEQAPPHGWKGHRTSHTRGYFGRPMWQVRRDARASLQFKRELWRAELDGHEPEAAHAIATAALERGAREQWELVALTIDQAGELVRVRPAGGGGVTVAMRSELPGERRLAESEHYGLTMRALDELTEAQT